MAKLATPHSKRVLLLILLGVLLIACGYLWMTRLNAPQPSPQTTPLIQRIINPDDHRPVRTILFIGNSRTYFNNLPVILENMAADIENMPFRYEVVMHAPGGHFLEDHNTSSQVQELLKQKWDYVVLQGGSPENVNPDMRTNFMKHGQELIQKIQGALAQPILFSAWVFDDNAYEFENEHYLKPDYLDYTARYQAYIELHGEPPQDQPAPETFFPLDGEKHYAFIQSDYGALSAQTHTLMVNVGEAFQKFLAANPRFSTLTTDGNHPSLQGSYLAAAMFHTCFSDVRAQSIRYIPPSLSSDDAVTILAFIDQFYSGGTCLNDE